jgi:hypothetical protein
MKDTERVVYVALDNRDYEEFERCLKLFRYSQKELIQFFNELVLQDYDNHVKSALLLILPRLVDPVAVVMGALQVINDPAMGKFLINCGPDPMLFYVLKNLSGPGRIDRVKLVVENGADVSILTNRCGETTLMWACKHCPKDLECIKYLVQKGCPVDYVCPNGWTALKILATRYQNGTQAMRWLLSVANANADLLPTRGDCRTALMVAAATGANACITALLSPYGKATLNLNDTNGRNAFDFAAASTYCNVNCLLMLIRCGAVFHPNLCIHKAPRLSLFLQEYPRHYMSALEARLGVELSQLVAYPENLSPTITRKINLDYGNDLELEDIFNLPYHRVLDGVNHFIKIMQPQYFYTLKYQTIPPRVQTLCKALAKAAHETQAARAMAEAQAVEYEQGSAKKIKV